jgi:DNA primase
MDVIALHRAGFTAAVAPLGTALTEFQLHELWRLALEPTLCFDGDAAGQQAAIRALRRALPLLRPGQSLRFARLPLGDDPDSIIRRSGRAAFEQILAAARPLADMLWESEVGGTPRDTPERLAGIQTRLMGHVRSISDQTVRSEFEILFKKRCDPWGTRRKSQRAPPSKAVRDGPEPLPRPAEQVQRENLFRILLKFPGLIPVVAEEFARLEIPESELDGLRREILEADTLPAGLDAQAIRQHLVKNGFAKTVDGLLSPSVDPKFLDRCSDPSSAHTEWGRIARMLMGGDRCALDEATNDLISDVSPENWNRFIAVSERMRERSFGEDQM